MKPQIASRPPGKLLLAAIAGLLAALPLIQDTAKAQEAKEKQGPITIEIDESGTVTVNGEVLGPDDDISDFLSHGQPDVEIYMTDDGKRVITIDGDNVFVHGGRGLFKRHPAPRAFFFRDDDGDDGDGDEDDAVVWFGDDFMGRLNVAPFGGRVHVDNPFPLTGGMAIGGPKGVRFFGGDGTNAEVMQMETKSRRMALDLRRADADDKPALEAELDALLADIFDKKQALRQDALADHEAHIAEERDVLKQRQQNRSEIIARRKAQLLGQSDW